MKQKLFKTLVAAIFLVSTMPGYAFVCARPCAMTQKQMLSCVKACASLKGGETRVSLSNPACMRLQINADLSFLGAEETHVAAPAMEISVSSLYVSASLNSAPKTVIFSRGSPGPSPVELALLEVPSQNSPPTAI